MIGKTLRKSQIWLLKCVTQRIDLHSLVKTVAIEERITQPVENKSTSERLIVDLKFYKFNIDFFE